MYLWELSEWYAVHDVTFSCHQSTMSSIPIVEIWLGLDACLTFNHGGWKLDVGKKVHRTKEF